ncbi:putative RWD domain-containing protein [Helianthus annuus]|nr:putative RWD domain-containing protein [Helianthus annuus]
MTDYMQEQEMEIEALKAILMDEFEGLMMRLSRTIQVLYHTSSCRIITSNDAHLFKHVFSVAVQLGLVFSHTHKYPDEIPLLNLKSIKGISASDLTVLKEKLEQEASENLGMAMIYSLVTSSKEWVTERFAHDTGDYDILEETANKDEIIVPHGEPVTVETFLAWREKFEAELALERAKLLPESALVTTKEKKLTGKQWFESGRASKRAPPIIEGSNDEDEDIDFDDDDDDNSEVDEEDMLDHYLAEKLDPSNQGR